MIDIPQRRKELLEKLAHLQTRIIKLRKSAGGKKKTKEALELSEQRYKDIFDNAPVSIIVTDAAGRMIDINPYHVIHIGRGRTVKKDYIGKSLVEHPNVVAAGISPAYRRLLRGVSFELKDIYFPHTTGGTDAYFNIKGVPLLKQARVVGTISIYEDITERKRNEEEIKKNCQLLYIINTLLRLSLESLTLKEQLERALEVVFSLKLVPIMRKGGIFLVQEDQPEVLVLTASYGLSAELRRRCRRIKFGDCLCGQVALNQKIICLDSSDSRHTNRYAEKFPHGHYVIPIKSDSKTLGVLMLYIKRGYQHNKEEEEFLQSVANTLAGIVERRTAEKKLEVLNLKLLKSNRKLQRLALMDPHTGLYNYRYLAEVIEAEFYRAKRYTHALSVLMLDVDYFKSINDVYGHGFGDLVLKQLAGLLKKMVRRYDVIVRFGGEEFVIISPGTDRATALVLARRLLEAINLNKFGEKKNTVKLKLSISVASFPEDKANKGMELISLADQILNKVKEFGGNRVYSSQDIKKKRHRANDKNDESQEVKSMREKIDKLTRRANQSLMEAVFAFARTIELKDHYTGAHVERTVRYATEISQALNLPREDIERVKEAAILHDLGKIGISERILQKRAKLSKKEFEKIKLHPRIGADIIRPIHFLHSIIPFVLYHHERWDGKGYPNGLRREEIPVGARIIAIADAYQALTSDRPYRQAYSKADAVKIIKKGSGTHFDPSIVSVLNKILEKER